MAETELVTVNINSSDRPNNNKATNPVLPNVEIEYSNLNYAVQLTKKQVNLFIICIYHYIRLIVM